ncbi:MAG: alanine racemase, partial [Oscillospiraceae bacterium]|nr:alanine racemase [Oscillospiraceae bacterium]
MDQLILDVTDIPQAKAGDTVTVFGRSEEAFLSVETLAALSGTIGYEIICGISRRVPRVYIRNGEPIKTVDYLLPNSKTKVF